MSNVSESLMKGPGRVLQGIATCHQSKAESIWKTLAWSLHYCRLACLGCLLVQLHCKWIICSQSGIRNPRWSMAFSYLQYRAPGIWGMHSFFFLCLFCDWVFSRFSSTSFLTFDSIRCWCGWAFSDSSVLLIFQEKIKMLQTNLSLAVYLQIVAGCTFRASTRLVWLLVLWTKDVHSDLAWNRGISS